MALAAPGSRSLFRWGGPTGEMLMEQRLIMTPRVREEIDEGRFRAAFTIAQSDEDEGDREDDP